MADSQINISSRHRFTTTNLAVVPELLGLSHELPFKNAQIKIQLPSADNLPKKTTNKSIVKSLDSVVTIRSEQDKNGRKIPVSLWIKFVDVQVSLNETITLPKGILSRPPNQLDLLSKQQQTRLAQTLESHKELANEASDLWIRILRWKSSDGSIARPEIHGFDPRQGSCLIDGVTKQRFWVGDLTLNVYLSRPITLSTWHDIEDTFRLGQESPIYIDSMFDGIEQLKIGNFQQCVVYLAVACEAFMRARVTQNLPTGLTTALIKYIDEAPIRQILENVFPDTLHDAQNNVFKRTKSRLHKLFDDRNTILHSGHKEDLTLRDCQQYILDTKNLIEI
jgi:hypothetical protein